MTVNVAALSRDELAIMVTKYLEANKPSKVTCKVGTKGGVSVYGFGRNPVTLYASQWDKLIENIDAVKAFIEANRPMLAVKA